MKMTFRQGIVRRQSPLTGPDWLQKTSLSGNAIDINANTEPVVFTLAHYDTNYLFEETSTVIAAWGGGNSQSNNGPLVPVGQTQYLYWDVDLLTGNLTRGWTLVTPFFSGNQPLNPLPDTHWFDTANMRMRVFQDSPTGGLWVDKLRLFAAIYDSNAVIIPYPLGTQIGSAGNVESTAGNLVFGTNNKPLKQSNGTFVTTESNLIVNATSGQNVKFDSVVTFAQASEEIPKFYLVQLVQGKRIALARNTDQYSYVSGIVIDDLSQDSIGQIVTNGPVRNEQWDWLPNQINKPVFCGPTGEIVLTPPLVGIIQQVGFIYDRNTIYLNIFPPIRIR